jgi:integrase/recombinase XerC
MSRNRTLVLVGPDRGSKLPQLDAADLLAAFLEGRNPRTLRAYSWDLDDFARFRGQGDARAALGELLRLGPGPANAAVLGYRAHLIGRGLAPATVSRRLSSIRSVVKMGRMLGWITWALDVPSPRTTPLRDTRGPGVDGWGALWAAAVKAGSGRQAVRDRAILRLLFDRALRCGEVVGLDLEDVDLESNPPTVAIIGKGRTERERLTINAATARALALWIAVRPVEPGPLFVPLDGGWSRLTGEAVRRIVARLSVAAGLPAPVRPHGLRHAAITEALDRGYGLRDVATFSRHRDIRMLQIYDDRRVDVGGEISRRLGGE